MPNWRELPLNDSRCTSAARDDAGYTNGYCRLHRRALLSGALWPLFFSSRRTSVVAYTDLVVDRIGFLPIVASGWWCTLNQRTIEYAGAPINTLFVRPAVGTPSPRQRRDADRLWPHIPRHPVPTNTGLTSVGPRATRKVWLGVFTLGDQIHPLTTAKEYSQGSVQARST